jgi:hypothetical protein
VRTRSFTFVTILAAIAYAAILAAFWIAARQSAVALTLDGISPRAFVSFALLFAPLWFFAFGFHEPLRRRGEGSRTLLAGLLALPYFAFAVGTQVFSWRMAFATVAFPVLLAGFLGLPRLPRKLRWRDAAALGLITSAYFLRWFQPAWPSAMRSLFPKLFLADVALYSFLVARQIHGSGYSLVPSRSAPWIGVREWLLYFPFAVAIGEVTGFIHFHREFPSAGTALVAILVTFLLVALPEELFFRSIVQNLLETRLGRTGALLTAAALFGLSHFTHGSSFNWRYVLLATIAGVFYGRAWRAQRCIFASVLTHTLVDVVWSLWFR